MEKRDLADTDRIVRLAFGTFMGYRTTVQSVAMETGDGKSGYNQPDVYIVDDWR